MTSRSFNSRDAVHAEQLTRLRELVGALLASNPYYGAILREAGVDHNIASLDDFVSRIPFTEKQRLIEDQAAHPPYGTNLTFPIERYTRFHQTSATTGAPMRWLDTTESWQAMLNCWRRVYEGADVHADDRVLFAFSFGPFLGFWTAFEAATAMGCLCIPAGGLSSTARLRLIVDNDVTVLCCTPTYALRLAEVARQEGIDLSAGNVRRIIVAGEPGGSVPATRAQIETAWPGARVYDHHGMTEVGPVTYECPERPSVLHIMEDAYLAEVVDIETGKPVRSGETGELILTTLLRVGSPLLRYRTGDLVKLVADQCKCGRHEPTLEGGILGRADDMVLVRGVNVYPSAVEQIIRKHTEVVEYQVEVDVQDAMTEILVTIESAVPGDDSTALAKRVEAALRDGLSLRVPVRCVGPGELPRYEMKAKRWRVRPPG